MHRVVFGWVLAAGFVVGCGPGSPVAPGSSSTAIPAWPPSGPTPVGSGWCSASGEPADPLAMGRCELTRATAGTALAGAVDVVTADSTLARDALNGSGAVLDPAPESFVIVTVGATTLVIGRDASGAFYGAQELAERIAERGDAAVPVSPPIARSPALAIRAANPFLVLPQPDEPSWWFLDRSFWREYLDLLARARINYLDLHGMYSLDSTIFPNALLYFATSASFPDVGVPVVERERNLAMLNQVIDMATARGIRVGLMSYRADTSLLGDANQALTDDASARTYTREAAADLARRAPGLWRLGFRIGESERPASWYEDTFVAGVRSAGTGVRLATRTWGAKKADILSIVAAAGEDTIVQAKFNGEHLAAPYAIAGGIFSIAGGYSYQNFLTPPVPYQFVFQIRAGGTHRIFRYLSYERTRRTVKSLALSPAVRGFTYEPPHAYFPARDYYHADHGDRFSSWTFRRDELGYFLFGRLGFDPATPASVFRRMLAARAGTDALWDAVQAASDIVPWMQTAHTCGIDSRDAAPELELAGDVGYWASPMLTQAVSSACVRHEPMDGFAVALASDAADDLMAGQPTTRLSPMDVARILIDDAAIAKSVSRAADTTPMPPEQRDLVRECYALADLGLYFAHKLRAASALAIYARSGRADYLEAATSESAASGDARRRLAAGTRYIAPFRDHLRMAMLGLPQFHWSRQLNRLDEDLAAINTVAAAVRANPPAPAAGARLPAATDWLNTPRSPGPGLATLDVNPPDATAATWTVTARLASAAPAGARVRILWKPFASESDWTPVDATPSNGGYAATIDGGGEGAMFAVEVVSDSGGWRYPDVKIETPYRVLSP
ncbi:MAG TPA: hypothetical protein VFH73_23395 [Polyangia bacterium]|nr:hypothetical protein [Polyangia bacterium]